MIRIAYYLLALHLKITCLAYSSSTFNISRKKNKKFLTFKKFCTTNLRNRWKVEKTSYYEQAKGLELKLISNQKKWNLFSFLLESNNKDYVTQELIEISLYLLTSTSDVQN